MRPLAPLLALLLPAAGHAQALSCQVPAALERPRPDGPDARTPVRNLPAASYTLALTWSPQYCREQARAGRAPAQCSGSNRFGFTLHGLWPDGAGDTWPQYCRPVPLLSEETLRRNFCATPSVQLQQHEWAKHGSCMNIPAERYFARARDLYGSLQFPDMIALSRRPNLTVGQLAAAIARANPGMPAGAVRVTQVRGQPWLDELWLCLDLRFHWAACGRSQDGGAAVSRPLAIWRGPQR